MSLERRIAAMEARADASRQDRSPRAEGEQALQALLAHSDSRPLVRELLAGTIAAVKEGRDPDRDPQLIRMSERLGEIGRGHRGALTRFILQDEEACDLVCALAKMRSRGQETPRDPTSNGGRA